MFKAIVILSVVYLAALAHGEQHEPAHTDVKYRWEHRDGDHVNGADIFKEADVTTKLEEYTTAPHFGFDAVVKKIGHAHHPAHYAHHGGAHH